MLNGILFMVAASVVENTASMRGTFHCLVGCWINESTIAFSVKILTEDCILNVVLVRIHLSLHIRILELDPTRHLDPRSITSRAPIILFQAKDAVLATLASRKDEFRKYFDFRTRNNKE